MLNSEIKKLALKDQCIGDVFFIKRIAATTTFGSKEAKYIEYCDLCLLPQHNPSYMLSGIYFSVSEPRGKITSINIVNGSYIKIVHFENITRLKRKGVISETEYKSIISMFLKGDVDQRMMIELLCNISKNYEEV